MATVMFLLSFEAYLLLALLLGEKHLVDVGEHTTGSNGHAAEKFVELLVIADRKLQVPRDDPLALVVTGGVSSQLKNLSAQVLKHGGHVHGSTTAEAWGKALLAHVSADTTNRELQAGASRAGGGFRGLGAARRSLSSFSSS